MRVLPDLQKFKWKLSLRTFFFLTYKLFIVAYNFGGKLKMGQLVETHVHARLRKGQATGVRASSVTVSLACA